MVTNTNLENADSSLKLLRHHNGTKFTKNFKLENSKENWHSRGMKCQPIANNKREALVV